MRLRWVTYRDAVVYHLVYRKSPWFPLSSLMLHGIIVGAVGQSRAARLNHLFSEGKKGKQDLTDFEHEVWTYFGMGVNLQELYVPSLPPPYSSMGNHLALRLRSGAATPGRVWWACSCAHTAKKGI